MDYETGDIAINPSSPGHAMMVYQGGNYAKTKIVHAQWSNDFHIQGNQVQEGGNISYLIDNGTQVFRPPWRATDDKAAKQRKLQQVAEAIRDHASYGLYRAFRLFTGSSFFGDGARRRLRKYKERWDAGFYTKGGPKFVTTVTCSEAVILCYQLTFAESDPQFIKLDAAHTMPNTLAEWLRGAWGQLG
jgi:hypothetical protein